VEFFVFPKGSSSRTREIELTPITTVHEFPTLALPLITLIELLLTVVAVRRMK
jgi:hypothetical protein